MCEGWRWGMLVLSAAKPNAVFCWASLRSAPTYGIINRRSEVVNAAGSNHAR